MNAKMNLVFLLARFLPRPAKPLGEVGIPNSIFHLCYTSSYMKQVVTSKGIPWTNLEDPSAEELAAMARELQLHPLDAEFIAANRHRPSVTLRSQYLLLLMHVPVFDKVARLTAGAPLYCIVTNQGLWSIHHQPIPALNKIIHDLQENPIRHEEHHSEHPLSFALYLWDLLVASAFQKLERLAKHIDIAEEAVFQGNERKMVEEIAVLTRDVMDFRKIIRPQRDLFAHLPTHPLVDSSSQGPWLRLHNQMQKLWEMLESISESVHELAKTNNSLLQHKQNELLRLLTLYSIVAIPVWILITPFNPRGINSTALDVVVFWGVLALLILALLWVLLRFRGRRVL